jgi:hypothetical protein
MPPLRERSVRREPFGDEDITEHLAGFELLDARPMRCSPRIGVGPCTSTGSNDPSRPRDLQLDGTDHGDHRLRMSAVAAVGAVATRHPCLS